MFTFSEKLSQASHNRAHFLKNHQHTVFKGFGIVNKEVTTEKVIFQASMSYAQCYIILGLCCAWSLSHVQLCNPMDSSPPGSSVHGDSPGNNTGAGCHSILQGIFQTQGSNPHPLCFLHWEVFFTTSATWGAQIQVSNLLKERGKKWE